MRAAILVVGAALAAAGCKKAQADRVEKSETTMHDRGERPWVMLRYDIPEGFEQTVDTVIDVELEMTGAFDVDVDAPRMIATERFTVDKVDAKGGMHLTSEITDVWTIGDGSGDDRAVEAVREAAMELDGMVTTATLLPDGGTRGLRIDMSSIPASAREQARQFEQAFDTIVARLPDVSVGVGATWTTEETVRMSNMKVFYTFDYEVIEISEDLATLHVDVDIAAPPQRVILPQGSAHLNVMFGTGSFEMQLDRHKVVDLVTGEITVEAAMSAMNQTVDMKTKMRLQVIPTGETPEPRAVPPPPDAADVYQLPDYNPNVIISN